MDTSTHLKVLFEQVLSQIDELGLPKGNIVDVRVNPRLYRCLGRCKKTPKGFEIEISENILLNAPEHDVKRTIAHEIIHTFPKCQNHGDEFKKYANIINRRYNYGISRVNKVEWLEGNDEAYKYILQCKKCGAKFYYHRLGPAVTRPSDFHCKCGGDLKRVK